MADIQTLADRLKARFGESLLLNRIDRGEVTIEVAHSSWLEVCSALRDEEAFRFEQLSDLCVVDYSAYGAIEWATDETTSSGFSRGVVERTTGRSANVVERYGSGDQRRRFGVVAHLLSYSNNWRLRVRTYAPEDELPVVPSLTSLWSGANWFEREAFDLFGVVFEGHDDLRRILTDYGFIGHPFRKDFPLVGHVEMRYDAERQRVIYQPVTIEPRVLVPRVVRNDHRYLEQGVGEENAGDA